MGHTGTLEGPGSGFWRPRNGPDGAEMEPKSAPEASSERSEIELVLEAVLEAVLGPEKGHCRIQAAIGGPGRRNGGGLRGGIKGGGLKPCKEFS